MATFVWLCLALLSQFVSVLAQSDVYLIHMDLEAMPKIFSGHRNWYDSILSSVSNDAQMSTTNDLTSNPKLLYTYSNAMHGFSARLSPSELKAIEDSPGFISAFRDDVQATVHTSHSYEFLGLNDVSGAWPVSNYGEDVIIGVVDTGVWPESKSYNDDGMGKIPSRWKGKCENGSDFNSSLCNRKLIGARSFNKAVVARDPTVTISVNSVRDTDGHGTHTSSTAAGNYVEGASYFGYAKGTVRGMAPKAHLAIYKSVFSEGNTASDTMAAIDQAIADRVDVLSLSLGFDGNTLYEEPIAIASFAAMEKGIFVAVSAGNRGYRYAKIFNGTPWILTVGSGTIDRDFIGAANLGNGDSVSGVTLYPGKSFSSKVPLLFLNTCNNSDEVKKVGNKIVVCRDVDESLGDQISNVGDGEVAGGIFITNITGLNSFIQTSFPAIFISLQDGRVLLDYIKKSSNPSARFVFKKKTNLGTKPAPTVSSFSSRGPSTLCPTVMKPDLIAPGSLILAAWTQAREAAHIGQRSLFNNFSIISGTSMSCPHAAGIAALIKRAHPKWSPAAIRSAMMTTSDALDNTQSPIKDIFRPADPLSLGAGHVNPNKALNPGLIYDTGADDYVKLLCGMNYTMKQIRIITKSSRYNCSNASLDLNYPSFIAFFDVNNSSGITQKFQRTVTNVGDALSTYTAKLTPISGYKLKVVPDRLAFSKKNQKLSYTLSIESLGLEIFNVFHGALSWVDVDGKHVVRSPIVATTQGTEGNT